MRRLSFHADEAKLAEYALGGLPSSERAELEAHLDGCARCVKRLAETADAFAMLADEVAPVAPRTTLKDRLFGSLDAAVVGDRA